MQMPVPAEGHLLLPRQQMGWSHSRPSPHSLAWAGVSRLCFEPSAQGREEGTELMSGQLL